MIGCLLAIEGSLPRSEAVMASPASRLIGCLSRCIALIFAMSLGASGVRSAEAPPKPVTTIDQIQFQQTNAQAQMEELQNRMFRLAELTREAEPDDAAKLLMAVRSA